MVLAHERSRPNNPCSWPTILHCTVALFSLWQLLRFRLCRSNHSSNSFFISGIRCLQSEMSLRSSSEKSFVSRSSQKNSATEIPKAAQQLSIVETVGLLPRFIMLEIVDWDKSASFASWYLTTRVHREARKYGLSNPYHSPPRYTIILYRNYAAALERIGYLVLPCICVLFGIECNEVVLSSGHDEKDCYVFLHFPAKDSTAAQVSKYLYGGSIFWNWLLYFLHNLSKNQMSENIIDLLSDFPWIYKCTKLNISFLSVIG